MKHFLLILSMLIALGTTQGSAQGKHRSHYRPATTASADTMGQGIEAYSDTTFANTTDSVMLVDSTGAIAQQLDNDSWDDSDTGYNPLTFWKHNFGWGLGSMVFLIFVVALTFLFLMLPFIIIIMVLRYLIRRHNDRIDLARQAMATGQPIPEAAKPIDRVTDEYLWRAGIKHVAIGIGLMVMFGVWNSQSLVGIGGLILCIGIGQMVMAKTSGKRKDEIK